MTTPLNAPTIAKIFRTIAQSRYSTKRFQPSTSIPSYTLQDILRTTLTSPSGFNLQPTNVILVDSQKIKKNLSQNAMLGMGNMYRAVDASTLAVFLSDFEPQKRISKIVELEQLSNSRVPGYMATLSVASSFLLGEGSAATFFKQVATNAMSPLKPMPTIDPVECWSYKNTSLVAQTYVLAATSHGLATCIMEGFDARRVKEILDIPDRYGVPMIIATGYEYVGEGTENELKRSPRLDFEDVFFRNTFGEPFKEDHLHEDNATQSQLNGDDNTSENTAQSFKSM